jgi:hypothetical protein
MKSNYEVECEATHKRVRTTHRRVKVNQRRGRRHWRVERPRVTVAWGVCDEDRQRRLA